MHKLILPVLLLCSTVLHAQKKLKAADLPGTWQVTALIADGTTIPLENDDALRTFLLKKNAEKIGKDPAAMTGEDTANIGMAVQLMAAFRNSTVVFRANKTYQFVMVISTIKNIENGTWVLNETAQTIRTTKLKNGKPAKSEIVKIIPKGDQLLVQMEKDKEEGFLVSKAK